MNCHRWRRQIARAFSHEKRQQYEAKEPCQPQGFLPLMAQVFDLCQSRKDKELRHRRVFKLDTDLSQPALIFHRGATAGGVNNVD